MEEDAKEIEYEMLYKGPIKDKTIWINCPQFLPLSSSA